MVIVMKSDCTENDINNISNVLKEHGLNSRIVKGEQTTIIGIVGDKKALKDTCIESMDGVYKCVPIVSGYKLVSRDVFPNGRVVKVGNVEIGGKDVVMMAGPCAVESEEQVMKTAVAVKKAGAKFLRGGAYKPRTSPYSFQGMEEDGLKILRKAADETGLKVVSEIVSERHVEDAVKYCDMIQIGARNMQNFELLKAVGKLKVPVLLKRGLASTIEEWLWAAEYIMSEGNCNVVLCERGIRTYETSTRNTLDISAVAVTKELSSLPIIVDPSHASGKKAYIESLSLAAIAAGADGLIIEVHPNPKAAVSDAAQQLTPEEYDSLFKKIRKVACAVDRGI